MGENTAKIRTADNPGDEPILVAQERLRKCPEEIIDGCWPPEKTKQCRRKKKPHIATSEKCLATLSIEETLKDTPLTVEEVCQETEPNLDPVIPVEPP